MPALPSSPAGTARNILLVEEYGALASAIGSALKKFAPAHRTHVVATLAAADAKLSETQPELLIVDFDPPQRGAVDFFNQLKTSSPETRVLVIAAGISREVLAARSGGSAFRFVEKPFDLAAFGAAVQECVGESGEPAAQVIRHLGLTDLLPLLCAGGATAVLMVDATLGRSGEIHLVSGQIVHAVAAGQLGADALQEMLRWSATRLRETDRTAGSARTIQQPWANLLTTAFRNTKPADKPQAKTKSKPAAVHAAPAKKVVIVDDTDLLLVFVEDVLSTAEPTLDIVTAGSGLAGVKEITATLPDVVVMDYSLPDISGDEVCARLLADEKTARIPVVMMSGHVPEMTATAERRPNVVAAIAKPFLSNDLVDLVRTTLAAPAIGEELPHATPVAPPISEAEEQSTAVLSPPWTSGKRNGQSSPSDSRASPVVAAPTSEQRQEQAAEKSVEKAVGAKEGPAAQPNPAPAVDLPLRPDAASSTQTTPLPPATAEPDYLPVLVPERSAPAAAAPHDPKIVPFTPRMAAVRIPAAASNAVILGLSLEVVSMQFSPSLQMAALRARPWSRTVSLHLHPHALPGVALPETGFELGRVDLDARGHMSTVRLTPTAGAFSNPPPRDAFPVADVAVLAAEGGAAMQLIPASGAPMTLRLFASFDLVGVELSASFGVASLVLKSRGDDLRVTLQPGGPATGATFKAAQVLLDRSAQIAEILLDAVA